ncbi:unnamed protein product [Linum tenue]|nr:unnamed protein product [Linum tenue]
MLSVVIRSALG